MGLFIFYWKVPIIDIMRVILFSVIKINCIILVNRLRVACVRV